jgi:hypothetical protein
MELFAVPGAGWKRDEVEDVREPDPRSRATDPGTRDAKAQVREQVRESVCDSPLMVRAEETSAVGAVR